MTGAELKAWRERLGKDEAWADRVLGAVYLPGLGTGYGDCRRPAIEKMSRAGEYGPEQTTALLTAYRAALKAEEARQAAERAQAEPVCPDGVTLHVCEDGRILVMVPYRTGGDAAVASVDPDGRGFALHHIAPAWTPTILRYTADLIDHLARKHAEGDRQRKLDAVRAAHEAYDRACLAKSEARRAAEDASKAASDAFEALNTARREAGL